MSPLLETIKLKNGRLFNLAFHNRRFNAARKEYFGISERINLKNLIAIPEDKKTGIYRCRVIYSPKIEKIEFIPYKYREIQSLKLVVDNSIDYRFKYSDRSYLQKLYEQRGYCDDILIIKNGFITDSFTANPIFFDGKTWCTSDTPLLPGTQRARYLEEGRLNECSIIPSDLWKYEKVGLLNALWDMDDMPIIGIENIG